VLHSADCNCHSVTQFHTVLLSFTVHPQTSVYLSPQPQYGLPRAHRSTALCADLALKPNNKCGNLDRNLLRHY